MFVLGTALALLSRGTVLAQNMAATGSYAPPVMDLQSAFDPSSQGGHPPIPVGYYGNHPEQGFFTVFDFYMIRETKSQVDKEELVPTPHFWLTNLQQRKRSRKDKPDIDGSVPPHSRQMSENIPITVDIPADVAAVLAEKARRNGQTIAEYAAALLDRVARLKGDKRSKEVSSQAAASPLSDADTRRGSIDEEDR
jgi:hypothetical protein